jgi:hypothetical protein
MLVGVLAPDLLDPSCVSFGLSFGTVRESEALTANADMRKKANTELTELPAAEPLLE